MVSKEDLKRNNMFHEADERLEFMKVADRDRQVFLSKRELIKVFVDHEAHSVRRDEITEEEIQLIRKLEAEKDIIVYYMIQDEGLWPDGCTFPRYTFLHVDKYVEDYQMVKEECIGRCGTVPAYVINLEEPDYSELAEICFMNVGGLIINAS